jgi:hypothetical protein
MLRWAEEAQHKGFWRKHRAVHPAPPLHPEPRVLPPQPQQVAVQRIHGGMALPFGQVKLRPRKSLCIDRVDQTPLHLRLG